jgi:AraC-like DNA-binding protein
MDLPCDLDLLALVLSGHEFPRHLHEGFTIGVIVTGCLEYRTSTEALRLEPGDLFLRPPGEVHTERAVPASGPLRYLVMYPGMTVVEALLGHLPAPEGASTGNATLVGEFRRLIRLAVSAGPTGAHRALGEAFAIVFKYLGGPSGRPVASRRLELTDLMRGYLLQNLQRRPSVRDLAPRLGLHPAYLRRVFLEETGLSPRSYLLQLRVMRARQLLGRGEPIARVVAAAGFADQSHLTHEFTRTMGYSPRRFQRELGYY